MTIGINGNEANVDHRVGVGQYAFELLSELSKSKANPPAWGLKSKIYLSSPPLQDLPSPTASWQYEVFGPRKLWTLTGLQKKLVADHPDVLFTPSHYAPLYLPCPSVISIMDMSFERFPQYFKKKDLFQLKYWTWVSAMQAKKILTISQFSKKEICEIYGFPKDRVVVTYPGFDKERFHDGVKSQKLKIKNTIQKYKISQPYLLYVGTLQPRKNLVRLVQAFSALSADRYTLVLAGMVDEGRGGWMYREIFEEVRKLGLGDKVKFTGYVPDEEVPYLLSGSLAYVLPSLYEGFGIPPVEAMATGVPVVVSKISCLSEICGQAAVYIDDPTSVSSIKSALEKILSLKATERDRRIEFGLQWVKRYNWEITARQTLDVLKNVANYKV